MADMDIGSVFQQLLGLKGGGLGDIKIKIGEEGDSGQSQDLQIAKKAMETLRDMMNTAGKTGSAFARTEIGGALMQGAEDLAEEISEQFSDMVDALKEVPGLGKVVEIFEELVERFNLIAIWMDALELQEVLKEIIEKGLESFIDKVDDIKEPIIDILSYLKDNVDSLNFDSFKEDIEKMLSKFPVDLSRPIRVSGGGFGAILSALKEYLPDSVDDIFTDEVKSMFGWLQSILSEATNIFPGSPFDDLKPDLSDINTGAIKDLLKKVLKTVADEVLSAIKETVLGLSDFINSGPSVVDLMFAPIELALELLELALSIIKEVVDLFFNGVATVSKIFLKVVNKPVDVPALSDMFTTVTFGKEPTLLNLLTLVVAAPLALLFKIITGKSPVGPLSAVFSGQVFSSATYYEKADTVVRQVVYGLMQILDGAVGIGSVLDEGDDNGGWDILSFFANLIAQCVSIPYKAHAHPPSGWEYDEIEKYNYIIWCLQWFDPCKSLIIGLCKADADGEGKAISTVDAVLDVLYEITHFGLFVKLLHEERVKNGWDKNISGRAGYVVDPLAGIILAADTFGFKYKPVTAGLVGVTQGIYAIAYIITKNIEDFHNT